MRMCVCALVCVAANLFVDNLFRSAPPLLQQASLIYRQGNPLSIPSLREGTALAAVDCVMVPGS